MPGDDTTVSIFDNVQAIDGDMTLDWGWGNLNWHSHFNVLEWAFAAQHDASTPIFDYYLIQVEGTSSFAPDDTWQVDSHVLQVQGGDLIDHSPPTVDNESSYTTSISTTIGGSIGFFGDDPTASISASVTMNSSKTIETADLTIIDRCGQTVLPDSTAAWQFIATPGSPMSQGAIPISTACLFRTAHGTGLTIGVSLDVILSGGDPNGFPPDGISQGLNGSVQSSPNLPPDWAPWTQTGQSSLEQECHFTFKAPPAPGPA